MMLLLAMLAGVLVAQASPMPSLAPVPSDNLTSLVGRWTCVTAQNATTVQQFELDRDTMTLNIHVVPASGTAYDLRESYRWDGAAARWIVDLTPQSLSHMMGSAPAWTDDAWTVEGTLRAQPTLPPEELRYVKTADGFTREFFMQRDGAWVSTSRSTCTR